MNWKEPHLWSLINSTAQKLTCVGQSECHKIVKELQRVDLVYNLLTPQVLSRWWDLSQSVNWVVWKDKVLEDVARKHKLVYNVGQLGVLVSFPLSAWK
jgi:hypothetical protein